MNLSVRLVTFMLEDPSDISVHFTQHVKEGFKKVPIIVFALLL